MLQFARLVEFMVSMGLRSVLILSLILVVVADMFPQQRERRAAQSSPEEKKTEALRKISQRIISLSSASTNSEENRFLQTELAALLERSRQAVAGSYLFDRLRATMEDLLEASEEILESRESKRDSDNKRRKDDEDDDDDDDHKTGSARQKVARELEKTYFRIQQGDYFARQLKERNGAGYVLTARRLYQEARAAFDASNYRAADSFAEASREVISAPESLTQAFIPRPNPLRFR